jgi:predicted HTH domain antitoxin
MSTFKVEIEVPSELRRFGIDEEEVRKEAPRLLVIKRFTQGTISSGKAAELLSMTRFEFMDLLAKEKLPLIDWDEGEIQAELDAIRGFNNRG